MNKYYIPKFDEEEIHFVTSKLNPLKNTIIKDGIDKSDYCVLFINKTFLNREWPCEEANLFLKKYVDSQEQRIFPILVNVSNLNPG